MTRTLSSRVWRVAGIPASLLALVSSAQAQVSFTIENHGPTVGAPDLFFGVPITEGDVLTTGFGPPGAINPAGLGAPAPPPIFLSGGFGPPGPGLGLFTHAPCVGHPGGTPCPIEVDAFSYGADAAIFPLATPAGTYWFSVDEYAAGVPSALPSAADVFTEGILFANVEASGDSFIDLGQAVAPPLAPGAGALPANTGAIDGDGLPNAAGVTYPGVGLLEPNPPVAIPPDVGDNLDGHDVDGPAAVGLALATYYSLDSAYPDPLNGFPWNASAIANGFVGGDVVTSPAPGGPPALYAPAVVLGLDLLGPDTDDLDALALAENGLPGYQPSVVPYDWAALGGTDMLLFSVRRGSAVIGAPDSIFGIPIEEGDILTTPLLGGLSPFPGIFIAAENLALGTVRSGTMGPTGFADELDALDTVLIQPIDCDMNGIADAADIAFGTHPDLNANGIPDPCEVAIIDCNMNGVPDAIDIATGTSADCNMNLIPDECDIAAGTSLDCDMNGVPDECQLDCNMNGVPDVCDIASGTSADCNSNGIPDECDLASGTSADCNGNGTPDECDIATGTSLDCQPNGIPDECEGPDCNMNGVPDVCDIASGTSADCNMNSVPDECDIAAGTSLDCNMNGIPDECEITAAGDCNMNGILDVCDIASGTSADCNSNGIPDECDIAGGSSADCDMNGVPDECQPDCNMNGIPDACEVFVDCNMNGVPDSCDIAGGTSSDCDSNGVPDECDPDCNTNGIPDACELWPDCNANGIPDSCDIASGTSADCDMNGVPDECQPDCNMNGIPDACEVFLDCNGNGVPDSCDIAAGTSSDVNMNGIPDECEGDCNMNGVPDPIDISTGTSTDINANGIPDECEVISSSYCYCAVGAPCGNVDPLAGCANASGGGALVSASGSSSVALDNMTLAMSPIAPFEFGIFYMGPFQLLGLPFGDGQRCVGGGVFRYPIINSGPMGVITFSPVVGYANANFGAAGAIVPFSTWNFQGWYRDPAGPCGSSFNLTQGLQVTFTP